MRLEKYYLDVTTEDGAGAIGYVARVSGCGLPLTLSSTLAWTAEPDAAADERHTWRGRLPAAGSERTHWQCPALDAAGIWQHLAPASPPLELWREPRGSLRWQVLAPRARVELQLGAVRIRGIGYVERIQLDLVPWRLPIDELRWGRFLAADHAVVWIEWRHSTRRAWCFHNAMPVEGAITADGVQWSGGELRFDEPGRTVRSGRLGRTAFGRWRLLRALLPRRIRDYDETKWCAPGTLRLADGAAARGWAIHERVVMR